MTWGAGRSPAGRGVLVQVQRPRHTAAGDRRGAPRRPRSRRVGHAPAPRRDRPERRPLRPHRPLRPRRRPQRHPLQISTADSADRRSAVEIFGGAVAAGRRARITEPGRVGLITSAERWMARPVGFPGWRRARPWPARSARSRRRVPASVRSGRPPTAARPRSSSADRLTVRARHHQRVVEQDRIVHHDAGRDDHQPAPGELVPTNGEQVQPSDRDSRREDGGEPGRRRPRNRGRRPRPRRSAARTPRTP